MVVRQTGAVATGGITIGVLLALAASGWIRGMLFHMQPDDPLAFVAGGVAVLLVAVAAAWLPARRASRTEPSVSMAVD